MRPRFFTDPSTFRAWLEAHHDSETELWVGFRKKGSGKPSITWPESGARTKAAREQGGVGVLPGAAALVPEGGDLVDRQRQEGRDEGSATRNIDRRLRPGSTDRPAFASC